MVELFANGKLLTAEIENVTLVLLGILTFSRPKQRKTKGSVVESEPRTYEKINQRAVNRHRHRKNPLAPFLVLPLLQLACLFLPLLQNYPEWRINAVA